MFEPTSNADDDLVPARKKCVIKLNLASPPLYHSSSSNREINIEQKFDEQSVVCTTP